MATAFPWTNNNPIWETILGHLPATVQPGTQLCEDFGPRPTAGSTGGAASYGWRHRHRMLGYPNPTLAVQATLANYLSRRIAYSGPGSEFRSPSYLDAMRPLGWSPEAPGDDPGGAVIRPSVTLPGGDQWTGLDVQHCWDLLWEVAGLPDPILMDGLLQPWVDTTLDLRAVAKARLAIQAEACAGMMRFPYGLNWKAIIFEGNGSDRGWGKPLDLIRGAIEAKAHGLLSPDANAALFKAALDYLGAALSYYENCGAAWYINAAGPRSNNRPRFIVKPDGTKVFVDTPAMPEGAIYLLPAQLSWWAFILDQVQQQLEELGQDAAAQRCVPIVKRTSQWCSDAALSGLGGSSPWTISLHPDALMALPGDPTLSIPATIPTIAGKFTAHFEAQNNDSSWGFSALKTAEFYGATEAAGKATSIFAAHSPNPAKWCWLVNRQRQYLVKAAADMAREEVGAF